MGERTDVTTIDAYISQFSPEVQARLQLVRETIKKAAPEASEKISWAMPTFYLNGNLIHFAAFKNHLGLYPGAEGIEAFKDRFEGRAFSKGAVQLRHDEPLPLELISDIVLFRRTQNLKAEHKK